MSSKSYTEFLSEKFRFQNGQPALALGAEGEPAVALAEHFEELHIIRDDGLQRHACHSPALATLRARASASPQAL